MAICVLNFERETVLHRIISTISSADLFVLFLQNGFTWRARTLKLWNFRGFSEINFLLYSLQIAFHLPELEIIFSYKFNIHTQAELNADLFQ